MFSSDFEQALKATKIPVAHFGWETEGLPMGDYIVYSENSMDDLEANGLHIERATVGTVDLFTRDYSDDAKDPVEQALSGLPGIVWQLETIQFEEETRYVHYSWMVGQYGEGTTVQGSV